MLRSKAAIGAIAAFVVRTIVSIKYTMNPRRYLETGKVVKKCSSYWRKRPHPASIIVRIRQNGLLTSEVDYLPCNSATGAWCWVASLAKSCMAFNERAMLHRSSSLNSTKGVRQKFFWCIDRFNGPTSGSATHKFFSNKIVHVFENGYRPTWLLIPIKPCSSSIKNCALNAPTVVTSLRQIDDSETCHCCSDGFMEWAASTANAVGVRVAVSLKKGEISWQYTMLYNRSRATFWISHQVLCSHNLLCGQVKSRPLRKEYQI